MYSFVHWVVMVFTFVLFKIFVTPVKSIQLFKIDNIISTTDQGINHRCKLKIRNVHALYLVDTARNQ